MKIGIMTSLVDEEAAVLITAILDEIKSGFIPNTSVEFVFTDRAENFENHPELLQRLGEENTPFIHKSSSTLRYLIRKSASNEEIKNEREALDRHFFQQSQSIGAPDIIVQIGYMLIISPWLCRMATIINLHPDLPRRYKGTWKDIIKRIIISKDYTAGAMIHLVAPELDSGPLISWFQFSTRGPQYDDFWVDPKRHGWLANLIRKEEFQREPHLLTYTLRFLSLKDIVIQDRKVYFVRSARGDYTELFGQIHRCNLTKYVEMRI